MGTTTTSAFTEALVNKRLNGTRCSITVALDQLDDATRTEAETALADPTVQHVQLEAAFKAIGHDLGASSIGRHRNRQCKCGA